MPAMLAFNYPNNHWPHFFYRVFDHSFHLVDPQHAAEPEYKSFVYYLLFIEVIDILHHFLHCI